jgi:hypothetical protein
MLLPGSGVLEPVDGSEVAGGVVDGKLLVLGIDVGLAPGTVMPPAAPFGPKLGAPWFVPLVPFVPLGPLVPFEPGIPLVSPLLGPR